MKKDVTEWGGWKTAVAGEKLGWYLVHLGLFIWANSLVLVCARRAMTTNTLAPVHFW